MAIKTSQVIYDIKELLNQYSDDTKYEDRHLLYLMNLKREKYLRQLLDDKTRSFDKIMMQTLCLEFELVDKGTCCLEVGCKVLRSKKPLPKLLAVRNRNTLISITPTVSISKSFKIIDIEQANYILDRPYSNNIYVTVDNNDYVYLISKNDAHKLITKLSITGIFSDPLELEDYTSSCSNSTESCFTEDSNYPAPAFIIDAARDEVIKLLTIKEQIKEDERNNSSSN